MDCWFDMATDGGGGLEVMDSNGWVREGEMDAERMWTQMCLQMKEGSGFDLLFTHCDEGGKAGCARWL